MSRFTNLEFNSGSNDHEPMHRHDNARDAGRFESEAQGAFEHADFEGALRAYSKAIEFNPRSPVGWTGQVRALIELGEFDEASLWADKALEKFPEEAELLAAKAVALARSGDAEGALAFSDASVTGRGDTPYVWLARGDVLLARQERRAEFCFEKALILAARDWFITWLAARIRAHYRQYSLALKLARQALELQPDHPILWLCAGACQQELGLIGAAQHSFQQAMELNPRSQEARLALEKLAHADLGTRLAGWWKRCFGR